MKQPINRPFVSVAGAARCTCSCAGASSYVAEVADGFVRVCRWGSAGNPSDMRIHGRGGAVLADTVRGARSMLED